MSKTHDIYNNKFEMISIVVKINPDTLKNGKSKLGLFE